jgi:integral membrane protein (TIGR01906 family)
MGPAAKWLFITCLPVLLFTISLSWAVNSHWLYKYGFDKYNSGQTTGLSQLELNKVSSELRTYFNSGEEYISLIVIKDGESFMIFNQREIEHLKDVKGLIRLNYWVLIGTLVYVLVYTGVSLFSRKRKYWRQLAWGVIGGSSIALVSMLALGLGTLLNFDRLFLQFHFISFNNDLWQLDPTKTTS